MDERRREEVIRDDDVINEEREEEICYGFNENKPNKGEYISVEENIKPVYYTHKFVNNLDSISEKSNEECESDKKYNFSNAKNSLIEELKKGVPNLMPKNMIEL